MTELTVQKSTPVLWSIIVAAALLGGCVTDKGSTTVYSGEVFHATGHVFASIPIPFGGHL